jgi:hypothetical protein
MNVENYTLRINEKKNGKKLETKTYDIEPQNIIRRSQRKKYHLDKLHRPRHKTIKQEKCFCLV